MDSQGKKINKIKAFFLKVKSFFTRIGESKPFKITRRIGDILLLVVATYVVFDIIAPTKTVSTFGIKGYQVLSDSMVPKYEINTVVYITKTKQEKLKEGDIIAFNAVGEFNMKDGSKRIMSATFTHYLSQITTDEYGKTIYKTQPYYYYQKEVVEANYPYENRTFDKWYKSETKKELVDLTYKNIIGTAIGQSRPLGNFLTWFNKYFGDRIMLLLIAINVFIVFMIGKIVINDFIRAPKDEEEPVLAAGEEIIDGEQLLDKEADKGQSEQKDEEKKE